MISLIKPAKEIFEYLLGHQGFMRYFKNTTWLFFEQLLRMLAGVFVGVFVARYLGPNKFGQMSYALAYTALFAGLSKIGIDNIVIKKLVSFPDEEKEIYSTAFYLKLIAGFIAFFIISLSLSLSSNSSQTNLFVLIIAAGLLLQSTEVVDFYSQAKVKVSFLSKYKIAQSLFSSVIRLFLIYIQADLVWFVLTVLIDATILSISYMLVARKYKSISFFDSFDKNIALELIKEGCPLLICGLLWGGCMRVDQILIKELLSTADLGLYSAALRIVETSHILPTAICSSLFPAIIAARKLSNLQYKSRLQATVSTLVIIGLVTSISTVFLSNFISHILFGEKFKGTENLLSILTWSGFFVFFGTIITYWVILEGKQKALTYACLTALLFNIIANYIFIPIAGIIAVAYIKVLTYGLLYTFILSLYVKNAEPIRLLINALNPVELRNLNIQKNR